MTSIRKLLMTALVALGALGAAASTAAAAETAIVEPAGAVSQPSLGLVTFSSSAATISCLLTVNLNLNEGPITAALNAQIGTLTGVNIRRPCNSGEVRAVLVEPRNPWPITIRGALELDAEGVCQRRGALALVQPERADPERVCGLLVELRNVAFELSVFSGFVNCLYGGSGSILDILVELILLEDGTFNIGLLIIKTPNSIRFNSGSILCPGAGEMIGTFAGPEPPQTVILT